MRTVKLFAVALISLAITGCSCRTKNVVDTATIPMAEDDSVLEDIFFAFDSYDLCDKNKAILDGHAEWLEANPEAKVVIGGHCDDRGTVEYNMVLGAHRANAAKEYLVSKGIASDRLSTISYGEALPLDPAQNEAAWAKNRRDHFEVQ